MKALFAPPSSSRLVLLVLPLLASVSTALAQNQVEPSNRQTIRVTGEATIQAKPDQAQIDVGVVTQAATAQAAATENATKVDAVLSDLRKALGSAADIKTSSYSLSPNYRYPREGGTPSITGYTASNIVQVTTRDLRQVGKIIDLATQSGANTIHSIRFSLKDEQAAHIEALREATMKARAQAEAIASALNLRISRVLHVEEGATMIPRPIFTAEMAAARAASAPTPIESGTLDVRATVTMLVEVAP
jgi:hypothetical protein